ncbi:hypothetical protein [Nocardioides sp.]|uniref:hypothetical protein n=1 Tax=Nocardioides sp. TaxID=35761 RepID=UPI0039E63814
MSDQQPVYYRLAAPVTVRFVGLYLLALAVLVFAVTVLVFALGISGDLIVLLALLGLIGLGVLGWWLARRAYVVRAAADGYTVRLVRGAGVKAARWSEVEDAVTTKPHGIPCVVLRLKDGRTTTIPVSVLAIDNDQFVRELQRHLQRGQGVRPVKHKRR